LKDSSFGATFFYVYTILQDNYRDIGEDSDYSMRLGTTALSQQAPVARKKPPGRSAN